MEPLSLAHVIADGGFVHQIKWDGIRGIVKIESRAAAIYTRHGIECTDSYPELYGLANQLRAKQAVLDGELTVFDGETPSFYYSLRRNRTKSKNAVKRLAQLYPVRYIVFDLLYLDGEDLRQNPLKERQDILRAIFNDNSVSALTENFDDGQALFQVMRRKNMEGIVSKRADSKYTAGKKHIDWYKTKTAKKLLCVVAGIYLKNRMPASLVLGVYRDGKMQTIGKVSSGLKQSDIVLLEQTIHKQKVNIKKDIVWINPKLTCWVRFAEWTHTGTLRHPVLLGFSDKDAAAATGQEISI